MNQTPAAPAEESASTVGTGRRKRIERMFTALFVVTFLGAVTLFFLVFIDGHYMRPVIEFEGPVTTEKQVYHPGELVKAKMTFCKYRNEESFIQWHLVDTYLKIFPQRTGGVAIGCYRDLVVDIEIVPKDQIPDTVHFEQILQYSLNPWNTVGVPIRTNDFQVEYENGTSPILEPQAPPVYGPQPQAAVPQMEPTSIEKKKPPLVAAPSVPTPAPTPAESPAVTFRKTEGGFAAPITGGFVTGTYSKYCYPLGYENRNLKLKEYFRSLADCGKPFLKIDH